MPELSNVRREKFAQGVVEGMNATEALGKAGYARIRQNAHRMITNDDVSGRVTELRSAIAIKHEVTTESLIQASEEVRQLAIADGQYNAAVSAIREMGVLSGKRVERTETGGPGDFARLDDKAFAERMEQRLAQLMASLKIVEASGDK